MGRLWGHWRWRQQAGGGRPGQVLAGVRFKARRFVIADSNLPGEQIITEHHHAIIYLEWVTCGGGGGRRGDGRRDGKRHNIKAKGSFSVIKRTQHETLYSSCHS